MPNYLTSTSVRLSASWLQRAVAKVKRTLLRAVPQDRLTPSFVIVGAKRAGTTSLHEYICGHPDVAPGLVAKGTHFFR